MCFFFIHINDSFSLSFVSYQYFGQHDEIFWKKYRKGQGSLSSHLVEMDTDPHPVPDMDRLEKVCIIYLHICLIQIRFRICKPWMPIKIQIW
jgi:hypothetical protein